MTLLAFPGRKSPLKAFSTSKLLHPVIIANKSRDLQNPKTLKKGVKGTLTF